MILLPPPGLNEFVEGGLVEIRCGKTLRYQKKKKRNRANYPTWKKQGLSGLHSFTIVKTFISCFNQGVVILWSQ